MERKDSVNGIMGSDVVAVVTKDPEEETLPSEGHVKESPRELAVVTESPREVLDHWWKHVEIAHCLPPWSVTYISLML